jgi:uncharacterized protein (DUF342 family)
MNRLTHANVHYDTDIETRLQSFENLLDSLKNELKNLQSKLEDLKLVEKTKTVAYKETYARKLFIEYFLNEFNKYGLNEGEQ